LQITSPKFTTRRPALVAAMLCALFVPGLAQEARDRVAQLERAAALIGANRLAEAEQQLTRVLKVAPEEAAALNLLGTVRAQQGKLDEAESLFSRAVAADGALAGAHMNLAYLYLLKRDPSKSAAELREVLRLEPANAEAGYRLLWLLLSQGRVDECVGLGEQLKATQTLSAPAHAVLGDAYLRKGDKAAALSALAKAAELKPAEPSYHFALGAAWLRPQPDLQQAEESFRRFAELRPGDAQGQLHLGYVLLKQKKYAEARTWLEKSVKRGAATPEAYYYLGLIAQGQNEDARAVELFAQAVRAAPTFAHAHVALGATYLKLKDYPRAQQSLETGAKLSPDDAKAHYNLAMLYARLKEPERAREEMSIVERLKSEGKAQEGEGETIAPPPPPS
jgi:Flp pilus assembly protein TadD